MDLKELNNFTSTGSKGYLLEVDLEYLKKLHNYSLAPDKIEIKRDMSDYQLKIADLYNFSIVNVKRLVPNLKKSMFYYENLQLFFDLRLGSCIRIQSITVVKPYIEFNIQKRIEAEQIRIKMKKCCAN